MLNSQLERTKFSRRKTKFVSFVFVWIFQYAILMILPKKVRCKLFENIKKYKIILRFQWLSLSFSLSQFSLHYYILFFKNFVWFFVLPSHTSFLFSCLLYTFSIFFPFVSFRQCEHLNLNENVRKCAGIFKWKQS